MINRSNKQYAQIRTMSELRAARERLAWKIEMSEESLLNGYEGFKQVFTLSYLTGAVIRKIESVRTWIATIYDGYRLAMSLFTRNNSSDAKGYADEQEEVVEETKEPVSQQ